ncbi:metal-dependent phosphohydrolase [Virgibacillus profundi]|uniref:Metal-dependent phosphohydrolase n=1 Tax=Virgibacillus profundi TaxID=2024555 RepID=A0A2A2IEE1_9BACI|nr:HD domain-containing protein [Virgibacillus profundi]PAV29453.1 metal-dependent phosphohydrolase [Virgibacillus profundi]PXY53622.1 HD domain-containing protein [Virgibacillus profundi]
MGKEIILKKIEEYVFNYFHNDSSGHDFYHMKRVAELAKTIAVKENADTFICVAAAWVHDIGDSKLFSNPIQAIKEMNTYLESIHLSRTEIIQINDAIKAVSFSKGDVPNTFEGKIVQDADRIDAIGAVGIARTFAYGGTKGQPIYHPDITKNSIQHFYDKLLKLKDLMNTASAKEMAEERHRFMEIFLDQFNKEW